MSPAPAQRYRHQSDSEDPYTAELRVMFMAAVDKIEPEVAQKLLDKAGPAFEALAEASEEEYWTLSELLEPHPAPRPDLSRSAALADPSPSVEFFELDPDEVHELYDLALSPRTGAGDAEAEVPEGPKRSAEGYRALAELMDSMAEEARQRRRRRRELAEALRHELVRWARPYNLHSDMWVLDHAARIFQHQRILQADAPDPPRLGIHVPWLSYASPIIPRPRRFRVDETRKDYLAYIERYMNQVEERLTRAGWEEGPEYRSLEAHLMCLALFQVAGNTYDEISKIMKKEVLEDGKTISRRNVQKAVKNMSEEIGLTPRTQI